MAHVNVNKYGSWQFLFAFERKENLTFPLSSLLLGLVLHPTPISANLSLEACYV
jgi:hypothetical protein